LFSFELISIFSHSILEHDITNNNLPHTTGFFFGNNPPDSESIAQDLQFIRNARNAIAEGKAVFYSSWW